MQTSRFGVDSRRERSWPIAIRGCRFACVAFKKLDVDCEGKKKRRTIERAREEEGTREKSDDGG